MPLHVPLSLDAVLALLGGCFTQPTFQTFRALVVGFLARVGEHTVTGMLVAARLGGVWHHSRAHDFFARAAWSPDALGLRLAPAANGRVSGEEALVGVKAEYERMFVYGLGDGASTPPARCHPAPPTRAALG